VAFRRVDDLSFAIPNWLELPKATFTISGLALGRGCISHEHRHLTAICAFLRRTAFDLHHSIDDLRYGYNQMLGFPIAFFVPRDIVSMHRDRSGQSDSM
jgi:hypothetical protein